MHPLLAPGTHVLRRGPQEVQVGLDPSTAVVLPSAAALTEAYPGLVRSGLALADDRQLRSALPPHDPDDPWLALGAASRLVGVGPDSLRRWADSGKVQSYQTPGGHRRFLRSSLE